MNQDSNQECFFAGTIKNNKETRFIIIDKMQINKSRLIARGILLMTSDTLSIAIIAKLESPSSNRAIIKSVKNVNVTEQSQIFKANFDSRYSSITPPDLLNF
ncbi:MAG: hypothetical protein WC682_04935 [Parcubacteria group bacterium]